MRQKAVKAVRHHGTEVEPGCILTFERKHGTRQRHVVTDEHGSASDTLNAHRTVYAVPKPQRHGLLVIATLQVDNAEQSVPLVAKRQLCIDNVVTPASHFVQQSIHKHGMRYRLVIRPQCERVRHRAKRFDGGQLRCELRRVQH